MTGTGRKMLWVLILIIIWSGAARAVWRLSASVARHRHASVSPHHVTPIHLDSLVQAALTRTAPAAVRRFEGTRESPFMPGGTVRSSGSSPPVSPARPRDALYLSGILLRAAKPQAILEDQNGASHICGEGDSVLGNVVVRIERDQVVLRDRSGTYSVRVRE